MVRGENAQLLGDSGKVAAIDRVLKSKAKRPRVGLVQRLEQRLGAVKNEQDLVGLSVVAGGEADLEHRVADEVGGADKLLKQQLVEELPGAVKVAGLTVSADHLVDG